MLLILAEHIMNSPNGAGPILGRGGRRPPTLYARVVLKALASANNKSIGHPLALELESKQFCVRCVLVGEGGSRGRDNQTVEPQIT